MQPSDDLFQLYHPYWNWEEISHNMWGSVPNRASWLQRAIEFTGDHHLYGHWMMEVANRWKYSCEHHLTKLETNRKPWIGHAAVALAIRCPEDIVREAWGHLTKQQQDLANQQAQNAIEYWERKHYENRQADSRIG